MTPLVRLDPTSNIGGGGAGGTSFGGAASDGTNLGDGSLTVTIS